MSGELIDFMQRAQAKAFAEGLYSKGTSRVVVNGQSSLCKPGHADRFWRPAGADPKAPPRCGVCHPPVPGLDVEWIRKEAAA